MAREKQVAMGSKLRTASAPPNLQIFKEHIMAVRAIELQVAA